MTFSIADSLAAEYAEWLKEDEARQIRINRALAKSKLILRELDRLCKEELESL